MPYNKYQANWGDEWAQFMYRYDLQTKTIPKDHPPQNIITYTISVTDGNNPDYVAFDNSMAWIFYAPKGTKPGVGQGEAVPASYDHDWIGDPAPCMPTAKGV